MPNAIKLNGDGGRALQVTRSVRVAGLVDENHEDEATRLAPVRVYAFDGLLLVFDREEVDVDDIAEVVETATRTTDSIYRARDASVSIAGNGYQVQLPTAADAGFEIGDTAPCVPAPGMLAIHEEGPAPATRLAKNLVSIRRSQYENRDVSSQN